MESLDCERRILDGVWQAIAGCLTSERYWVGLFIYNFFLFFQLEPAFRAAYMSANPFSN